LLDCKRTKYCRIEARYNYQTALLLSNTLKDEGGFKL
jgi:hypothetical protein